VYEGMFKNDEMDDEEADIVHIYPDEDNPDVHH
jgi:hypothetical protein